MWSRYRWSWRKINKNRESEEWYEGIAYHIIDDKKIERNIKDESWKDRINQLWLSRVRWSYYALYNFIIIYSIFLINQFEIYNDHKISKDSSEVF